VSVSTRRSAALAANLDRGGKARVGTRRSTCGRAQRSRRGSRTDRDEHDSRQREGQADGRAHRVPRGGRGATARDARAQTNWVFLNTHRLPFSNSHADGRKRGRNTGMGAVTAAARLTFRPRCALPRSTDCAGSRGRRSDARTGPGDKSVRLKLVASRAPRVGGLRARAGTCLQGQYPQPTPFADAQPMRTQRTATAPPEVAQRACYRARTAAAGGCEIWLLVPPFFRRSSFYIST